MDTQTEQMIEKTVEHTLTKLGFDISDPISAQEDMHFLRALRGLTQAAGARAIMILVGLITVAVVGGMVVAVGKAISKSL